jgi:RNA polymerase sigma-70 factor (ECF subfamily)
VVTDVVERAWQAGRAAWPAVAVERDAFATHVQRVGEDAAAKFGSDLYLVAGCLAGDPAALAAFDREILGSSRSAIGSIDSSEAFVDEAVQRLRSALFVGDGSRRKIADYAARGPLRAWVGVAAARTALMMRRSQRRSREVPEDDWTEALVAISTGDPELELLKKQYAAAFAEALRDAVAALEPRLRAALRMSFVDGLSIDEIGAVYAVHRATAARWIQRACDGVSSEARRLLAERLKLSSTDLDRLTAMVQSHVDVSLSQLLPPDSESG